MFEFLKSKSYQNVFSFLLGLFIVLIVRPSCKDDSCIQRMNPDVKEMSSSTYQLGSKCYQFQHTTVDCEVNKV
jgi:hypothetical protein|uniref:Uncharacterized protein n=1 Tax=viral metagenome TaxID=1070528 RepID=A0A6C0IFS2_9ZZZZ